MRSILLQGPLEEGILTRLTLEERYVLFSYADDLKPGINSIKEVKICVRECDKLQGASGIKLHKNPDAGKIKILPLGKWR